MPALKYEDHDGTFKTLAYALKGDKGDKGDTGPPTAMGPLDGLSDVTAPSSTPSGKLLGTTATGAWGPVDPSPTYTQAQSDSRYVNVDGDTMTNDLVVSPGNIKSMLGYVFAQMLYSNGGVEVRGKATMMSDPTVGSDGANKQYVDSRIWFGTQAQYNAISVKNSTVLYVVTG